MRVLGGEEQNFLGACASFGTNIALHAKSVVLNYVEKMNHDITEYATKLQLLVLVSVKSDSEGPKTINFLSFSWAQAPSQS